MSADNYYVIRVHPDGGFAAVMGFASDDDYPAVEGKGRAVPHERFPTIEAALLWASAESSEYGVQVHPEVRGEPALVLIEFCVCEPCLTGAGGECHVPGCTFWMQDAPLGSVIAWLRERRA